jgi:Ras-related protein Rab-4B
LLAARALAKISFGAGPEAVPLAGGAAAGAVGGGGGPGGGDRCDYVLKFIIIGDASVGKSCVLHQFVESAFRDAAGGPAKHTIGVEFGSKPIMVGADRVKLQLWDTAGQERFRSVCHSYYRGAAGALVVYDVTSEESFENLPHWLDDARALAGKDVCIIICGNKADLASARKVDLLEASRFAHEQRCLFLETSAATGHNVHEVFYLCARTVLAKVHGGEIDGLALQPAGDALPRKLGGNAAREAPGCSTCYYG